MNATGSEVFDQSVHEANAWLNELLDKLAVNDRHVAYRALRAALHALRDRIGPENAVHLGAQLPLLIRGVYYEGWRMTATPTRERHMDDFLAHVEHELTGHRNVEPEAAARAVYELLWERLDPGEIAKLINVFPLALRDLWPRLAR